MTSGETQKSGGENPPNGQRRRVLLAEDNPINQRVCEEMLRRLGVEVHTVADGRQAVEALEQNAFDAVLMDCQMPELDGYRATSLIREAEKANGRERVPIIALTAHAMEGDREACLAVGMDDYLSKPFRLADLEAVLQRWTAAFD